MICVPLREPRSNVWWRRYGVSRYPGTFLVGRDGRIKSARGKLYKAIERELAVKPK